MVWVIQSSAHIQPHSISFLLFCHRLVTHQYAYSSFLVLQCLNNSWIIQTSPFFKDDVCLEWVFWKHCKDSGARVLLKRCRAYAPKIFMFSKSPHTMYLLIENGFTPHALICEHRKLWFSGFNSQTNWPFSIETTQWRAILVPRKNAKDKMIIYFYTKCSCMFMVFLIPLSWRPNGS